MKTKKGSIESSILEVWKNAAEKSEAERLHMQSYELGTDRYTEYTKNLTPGQEVTQKLDEKGLPPWLDKDKKGDDKDDKKADENGIFQSHSITANFPKTGWKLFWVSLIGSTW